MPNEPSLFAEVPQPADTWITAHCDGGARGNPGPAGYGAVVTGPNGELLAELSEFLGFRTNNYAEYSGLLAVLQYALTHNHPRLRVVSDSELMVKQIQGKYKVNSPDLKPLWQEAKSRIARLKGFEISHALRHKNKDADRLANEAMDRGMRRGPGETPRPQAPGQPTPAPLKATPYPKKSEAPPNPDQPGVMLRGFTRDGVVHILGNHTLPDGVFVKIIRE
jgi:ribonuclease HI